MNDTLLIQRRSRLPEAILARRRCRETDVLVDVVRNRADGFNPVGLLLDVAEVDDGEISIGAGFLTGLDFPVLEDAGEVEGCGVGVGQRGDGEEECREGDEVELHPD